MILLIKLLHFRLLHWRIQVLRPAFLVKADSWVEKASILHPIDQTIVDARIAIQDIQTLVMAVVHLIVPTVDQQVHADANRLLPVALLMVVLHHVDALETRHATMMNKSFTIF